MQVHHQEKGNRTMNEQLPNFITEASGRLGDRVYLKGGGKVRSRRYHSPRDPRTAGQQGVRSRFAQASQSWRTLSEAQRTAWNAYGATRQRTAPTWAETNTQNGYGAFMSLALKRLHAQPDADLLVGPPAAPFAGNAVATTAQAGAGKIVWRASGPSVPGVVTELLAQKLRRVGGAASPEKYRTVAFAAFAEGHLTETTALAPGLWTCAVRQVHTDTGQATALRFLPPVWVPT